MKNFENKVLEKGRDPGSQCDPERDGRGIWKSAMSKFYDALEYFDEVWDEPLLLQACVDDIEERRLPHDSTRARAFAMCGTLHMTICDNMGDGCSCVHHCTQCPECGGGMESGSGGAERWARAWGLLNVGFSRVVRGRSAV